MSADTRHLQDRIAVVTGAGQGIGQAIAGRFTREGARVVIAELVAERGEAAAAALQGEGLRAQAVQLDITDGGACQEVTQGIVDEHGRIDILVNSAGVCIGGKAEEVREEDWRLQIDILLTGVFLMTQAVVRQSMIPRCGGSIVHVASITGMGGWPMRSAYTAAKAGVIKLNEMLATEWAQYNIRTNCVSPGVTRTAMIDDLIRDGLADLERYDRRTPLGRIAETEEIADVVAFLASDRASYITGQNLRADGGWVAWGNLDAAGFPEQAG